MINNYPQGFIGNVQAKVQSSSTTETVQQEKQEVKQVTNEATPQLKTLEAEISKTQRAIKNLAKQGNTDAAERLVERLKDLQQSRSDLIKTGNAYTTQLAKIQEARNVTTPTSSAVGQGGYTAVIRDNKGNITGYKDVPGIPSTAQVGEGGYTKVNKDASGRITSYTDVPGKPSTNFINTNSLSSNQGNKNDAIGYRSNVGGTSILGSSSPTDILGNQKAKNYAPRTSSPQETVNRSNPIEFNLAKPSVPSGTIKAYDSSDYRKKQNSFLIRSEVYLRAKEIENKGTVKGILLAPVIIGGQALVGLGKTGMGVIDTTKYFFSKDVPLVEKFNTATQPQNVIGGLVSVANPVAGMAIINSNELVGSGINVVTNPSFSSIGQAGGTVAGTYGMAKIPTSTKSISKIINYNEFTKQQVVLSSADTFGQRTFTPREQGIFKPKLEQVNTLETPYGIIEIERKPIGAPSQPSLPKPNEATFQRETFNKGKPSNSGSGTSSSNVDFNKLDFSGRSGVRFDRPDPFLLDKRSSLSGTSPSLQLEYAQPKVIYLEEVQAVKTIPKQSLSKAGAVLTAIKTSNVMATNYKQMPEVQAIQTPIADSKVKQVQNIIPQIDIAQLNILTPKTETVTKTVVTPIIKQEQRSEQILQQQQQQQQKQKQKMLPLLETTQEYSLPKPSIGKSDKKKSTAKLYVKRKGKFELRSTGEDSNLLFKQGEDILKNTLRASFKVTDESGRSIKPFIRNNQFTTSKRDSSVIVQKREFRLGSFGERKEIQSAKRRLI